MISRLDEAHIDIMLLTHRVGRLACSRDNRPYVVPITYVYHEGYIYGHSNDGEKIAIMRQNPHVCLEVDEIQDPVRWRSVVAKGEYEELRGQAAAEALDILVTRLSPYVVSEGSLPEGGTSLEEVQKQLRMGPVKGVVYRIRLTEKSGRFERR